MFVTQSCQIFKQPCVLSVLGNTSSYLTDSHGHTDLELLKSCLALPPFLEKPERIGPPSLPVCICPKEFATHVTEVS